MKRPSLLSGITRVVLVSAAILAACIAARAQWTETLTVRGRITAAEPPDDFDVAGDHVVLSKATEFVSSYHLQKTAKELRGLIAIGTMVEVFGSRDHASHTITATRVTVHDDVDRKVSGLGVIDRVIPSGSEPVFRADGYVLRLDGSTDAHFSNGMTALSEVGTNTWVRFEGHRIDSGDVVAVTRVEFIKPKLSIQKRDPNVSLVQVTSFPPGSLIDFDGGFRTDRNKHRMEDAGGTCGWYPVPQDPALQRRVREIGERVVPQYQRDLLADDVAKIPFRFYVVDELDIRSDLSCRDGLVLVPAAVVGRLHNDSQLAAVLADGVAANLQRQRARVAFGLGLLKAAEVASYIAISPAGIAGTKIVGHDFQRKLEDERGRIALGLMADAGFDPWEAPEAWRLLAPGQLPKDLAKLKYPARSDYLMEILWMQYKRSPNTVDVQTPGDNIK